MTLKIEMFPAFMNECLFEIKAQEQSARLLVIKSALPEAGDPGAGFNVEIPDHDSVAKLKRMLFQLVDHPTPLKEIVIADGILFRIAYASEERAFKHQLSSIPSESIEADFVLRLFEISRSWIPDTDLQEYLDEVKREYL